MSHKLLMETILTEIQEVKKGQVRLEEKLDSYSKDSREYTDSRIKEQEERARERIAVLEQKLAEQQARLEEVSKWSEGVKAKWALITGGIGIAGGGIGTMLLKYLTTG